MQLTPLVISFSLLTGCSVGAPQLIGDVSAAAGTNATAQPAAGRTEVAGSAGSSAADGGSDQNDQPNNDGDSTGAPTQVTGSGNPDSGSLAADGGTAGADGQNEADAGGVDTAGVDGADGNANAAGSSGAAGTGGVAAPSVPGCASSAMLAVPDDTSARGPWPVGEKTVKFARFSAVEVLYPATPGSETGKPKISYDLRTFLPTSEQKKIPVAQAVVLNQSTYRDLPIDKAHGAYPVVIFMHGTASFRLYAFSDEALWASRGFVVIAADHPGFDLADYLAANGCAQLAPASDPNGDVDAEIAAVNNPSADLSFLTGLIDAKRLALVGHSAGAYETAQYTSKPGVQMFVGLAGVHAADPSPTLKSVLYVGGMADMVLPYKPGSLGKGSALYPGNDTDAYSASPGPPAVKKRLVGITAAGHLNVTDMCQPNSQGKSAIDVAAANGVCGISNLQTLGLADCGAIDRAIAVKIVNDVTTAALEETLQCADRASRIASVRSRYSAVGDLHEALP
jgi:pimeloyl-ACP methyl ester carboxylesterase